MIELLIRTIDGRAIVAPSRVYAERSGVMNTAIEGIFLMGAWAGLWGHTSRQQPRHWIAFTAIMGVLTCALRVDLRLSETTPDRHVPAINIGSRHLCILPTCHFGPLTPLIVPTAAAVRSFLSRFSDRPVFSIRIS
jgi:hypothetical protein